jgi:transcriptional regulator GlxA family with amidase domain
MPIYTRGKMPRVPPAFKSRRVVILAAPGTQILDLAGPFQVFVRASEIASRSKLQLPPTYIVEVVGTQKGLISTNCGLYLKSHLTYHQVKGRLDTLLIAGGDDIEEDRVDDKVVEWVRRAGSEARRVGSICTGAFLLAKAGFLAKKAAATHWKYCARLQEMHPETRVDPVPIFIQDGNVYTSAGVTAGMDLTLALVEEDLGSSVALAVSRELVLYMRRPGVQSQISPALSLQMSDKVPLRDLALWVLDNLTGDLSVSALARQAGMSPRNFARVFRTELHTTPAKFVEDIRVQAVRRRLLESKTGLKQICLECGFKSAGAMRTVFRRALNVSPTEYRRANQRS